MTSEPAPYSKKMKKLKETKSAEQSHSHSHSHSDSDFQDGPGDPAPTVWDHEKFSLLLLWVLIEPLMATAGAPVAVYVAETFVTSKYVTVPKVSAVL